MSDIAQNYIVQSYSAGSNESENENPADQLNQAMKSQQKYHMKPKPMRI
jgi:hypothetical protein